MACAMYVYINFYVRYKTILSWQWDEHYTWHSSNITRCIMLIFFMSTFFFPFLPHSKHWTNHHRDRFTNGSAKPDQEQPHRPVLNGMNSWSAPVSRTFFCLNFLDLPIYMSLCLWPITNIIVAYGTLYHATMQYSNATWTCWDIIFFMDGLNSNKTITKYD